MKALFILFFGALTVCNGYKVLVISVFPVRSMNNLGEGIVRHLLNAGYEVTYVTCYPKKQNNPKLREIDISDNIKILENDYHLNISYLLTHQNELSEDLDYLQGLCMEIAEKTLQNKNVQALLDNPKETFDVVVSDIIETEIYAGFAALYNCPLVWSYSMGAHWLVLRLIGDPTNPAYATDYNNALAPPYNFLERFQVLWNQIKWRYCKYFRMMPKEKQLYKRIFGPAFIKRAKPLPDYEDIIYNGSLILSNEHHASGEIAEVPQNWKLVGGYHIEVPPKPLPKDLQDIMDNAKHGVIFFSMGSIWKSELVPKEITEGLLKLFGELKTIVIWKYEGTLKNLPKNVHTVKWAPQQSILAHPNCKLFISHGGLLSSTEAIHFGVPTVGVPVSYDQFINVGKAVKRGYAKMVELSFNLPKDLKSAVQEMLGNPKYKQTAMEVSAVYHDRPVSPGVELAHWVTHVVRTRGAPHLRSPARHAPFYQKAYIDVVAVLCAPILLAVVFVAYLCFGEKRVKEKRS